MNHSQQAVKLFNDYARPYADKYMDVCAYHAALDDFCATLPKPNANILELACGPGNITRYLIQKRPDFKILGTDLAPNMLAIAQKNNPTADFQVLDVRAVKELSDHYDAVVCSFCLPYLSKSESCQLITDVAQMLPSKGVFYLSTMEGCYATSGFVGPSSGEARQIFTYYYEVDFLVKILEEQAFRLLNIYQQSNGAMTDLILLAQKQ